MQRLFASAKQIMSLSFYEKLLKLLGNFFFFFFRVTINANKILPVSHNAPGDSPTLKLGAVSVSVARPFSLMMVVVFPFSQVLWQRPPLHVSLQMVGVKTSLIRPV